jgi:arsenate reductase-like glutaredoxin family protein
VLRHLTQYPIPNSYTKYINNGIADSKLLQWLKDFSYNHRQSIRVEGRFLKFLPVKSGVLQGSVSGSYTVRVNKGTRDPANEV